MANRRGSSGLLIAAFVLALFAIPGRAGDAVLPLDAVGRLIADGSRFCTAFLVRSIERRSAPPYGMPVASYENWIVSAGHCLGSSMVFQLAGTRYKVERVIGFSAGGGEGFDIMVAAFSTPRPLPVLEPAFGVHPNPGDPLLLIGFGRKALMMRVGPLTGYDDRERLEVEGYASPGNSGGPLLIPGTRLVVGIAVETAINVPAGAPPMHCRVARCAVKPPFVAAHVDLLRGIAPFR